MKLEVFENTGLYGNQYKIGGVLYNNTDIILPEIFSEGPDKPHWVKPFTQPWQNDPEYVEAVCRGNGWSAAVFVEIAVIKEELDKAGYKLVDRLEGDEWWDHPWWMAIKK